MNPVFVIGCPRSGTTLLRLILTSHSGICIPHEYPLFEVVQEYFPTDNGRIEDADVDRLIDEVYSHPHFLDWEIDRNEVEQEIRNCDRSQSDVIDRIYRCHAKIKGKPLARWGDKYIKSIGRLPKMAELFPEAKFIHIIRDGRDVYASFREKKWDRYRLGRFYWTSDSLEISHLWNEANTLAMQFGIAHPDSLTTVRYEDLIVEPENVIPQICTFLNVAFEPSMLNFHEENVAQNLIPVGRRNAFHENTTRPIMADNSGKHSAFMSAKQIEIFNRNSFELLSQFNYIGDNDPVATHLVYQCSLKTTACKSRLMTLVHRTKNLAKKQLGRK